jgi:hypothetical protein
MAVINVYLLDIESGVFIYNVFLAKKLWFVTGQMTVFDFQIFVKSQILGSRVLKW